MGTEILHPQDLLANRHHASPGSFYRRRNLAGNGNLTNLIVNRRPIYNTPHKKTSPRPDKKRSNAAAESGGTKKVTQGGASEARRKDDGGLVMGKVTLLRRGESLGSITSKIDGQGSNPRSPNKKSVDDLAVLGTNRIGPDSPVMLPKQILLTQPSLADVYAGSAFILSPSPRSLPLPSFFNKKEQINDDEEDNLATRDLRRMLRLE
ncbi:hypothetical protein CASFOL_029730 [Castilleja foliolosa]|uniref:Uncharacterized protein n=1 Tax=Castilleja foliolosa TaxID=1961234 RepID=A0ABD3C8S2_9LAMI